MSKLEDKLSASIKPKRDQADKPATDKSADKPAAKPAAKPRPAARETVTDLNAPGQALHPFRIWPD
jgi:hypothetical protein